MTDLLECKGQFDASSTSPDYNNVRHMIKSLMLVFEPFDLAHQL